MNASTCAVLYSTVQFDCCNVADLPPDNSYLLCQAELLITPESGAAVLDMRFVCALLGVCVAVHMVC